MSDLEAAERHEDWAEGPGQCSRCGALVWDLQDEMCDGCLESDAQNKAQSLLDMFGSDGAAFLVAATELTLVELDGELTPKTLEAGMAVKELFVRMGMLK